MDAYPRTVRSALLEPAQLVGLPYRWGCAPESGATDCFQLACWLLRWHGFEPPDFGWVYCSYREDQVTADHLLQWCESTLERSADPPILGVGCSGEAGLITITPGGCYLINLAQRVAWISLAALRRLDKQSNLSYFRTIAR